MTRQCSAPGCRNGSGLHQFPSNPELRLQWLRALGITDHDLVSRAAVCNEHFSPECFSNLTEVKMGFSKVLHLRSGAVPTKVAPPPARVTSQSGSLRLIMVQI
uniref:THAP domain-containing protein 1 n=1 Tax=Gouania willdenowi TaxID=441366 RepID=A0A8C5HQY1_GOUWI